MTMDFSPPWTEWMMTDQRVPLHLRVTVLAYRDADPTDVLYLDPPYNHRQYGANYHVLETIASYDNPLLSGVTGMRSYPRSLYCRRRSAREALEHLVRTARARHILLSYNDEGLLSIDEVRRILSLRGRPRTFHTAYSRFKADNGRTYKRDATVEFIHYVRVIKP